jgi:hypothetical protein
MQIMTRSQKISVWIGTIIIVLVLIYFLILPKVIGHFITAEPRNPKNEINETFQIGWWSYQESLVIDSFKVELVESKLNLFNNKSLIRYRLKGKLIHDTPWQPYIKTVHISQRFIRKYNRNLHPYLDTDTTKMPEAIIEITPVVKVKENQYYKGDSVDVEFTNEIKLESFHWGNNWVRLQCGDKWVDLILKQSK